VVTVTVDAGRREDLGQPIEELQGRETQGGPACGIGLGEDVEDLVRVAADKMQSVECKRRPGTVADQPLQSFAVCGLDADTPVQAKAAAVIPAQHIPGVGGLQEAVAAEVAEDPVSDRVLEALQELVGEGGGFVEAEAGFRMRRILSRVTLNLLEEPVHDAEVVVKVGIEGGAETVEETHGAERGLRWCARAGLSEGSAQGPEQDVKDGRGGAGPVMEEGAEALGEGEHELAHGDAGNDVIDQVGCGSGHTLGVAGGAGAPALARKRDEEIVPTGGASDPSKAVGQDSAFEVAPQSPLHVRRDSVAQGIGFVGQSEIGLQVFPDDAVERGGLGPAAAIALGLGGGRRSGRKRRPAGLGVSGAGLCGHRWSLASRGARECVSTPKTWPGGGGGMDDDARRGSERSPCLQSTALR
jgi:hypothetical protein